MTEKIPSAEIIKGPWKQTTNTPTKAQISKAKDLVFCEEISHTCLLGILETLVENGIDVDDISFIRYIAFITESIKAAILTTKELDHSMQELIELTTDLDIKIDDNQAPVLEQTQYCEINLDTIDNMVSNYKIIMDPNNDIS